MPLCAAVAVTAGRLEIGKFFDRPHFDRHAGKARYRRRGRLPGAGIGRRDDERRRLRPARRDLARLFVAALRQLDRREIMARHAGVEQAPQVPASRTEEPTSELPYLMRLQYDVLVLQKNKQNTQYTILKTRPL